jgi:hypothetical protein
VKTIWKFPVSFETRFEVMMPAGAKVINVQTQIEAAQMWALVDTEQPAVRRQFMLVGTGHPIEEEGEYVGTFLSRFGGLVLHLFEVTP